MGINRVKLNYMPVASVTPPVDTIKIPSSHMEALDRVMKEKAEQNRKIMDASISQSKNLIVR